MNVSRLFKVQLVALVCGGLLLSQSVVLAGQPLAEKPAPQIHDVALGPQGSFHGQIVDQQGLGLADVPVAVRQQGKIVAHTVTDKSGRFLVKGLRGGTCQVIAPNGTAAYRLWTPKAAPPSAQPSALIVSDNGQLLRAQWGNRLHEWCLPALAAGGVIAGVAVATSNSGSTPASP